MSDAKRSGASEPTARDVMNADVLTVGPEAPLTRVAELFLEEGIHGAPVVDETEAVIGVIATTDILRVVEEEHDAPRSDAVYFRDTLEYSGPDWSQGTEDFQDRLAQLTVADAMQTSIVAVDEGTPVSEIAKRMRADRIHRVLVTRRGRLVGIVTTLDLIGLLER